VPHRQAPDPWARSCPVRHLGPCRWTGRASLHGQSHLPIRSGPRPCSSPCRLKLKSTSIPDSCPTSTKPMSRFGTIASISKWLSGNQKGSSGRSARLVFGTTRNSGFESNLVPYIENCADFCVFYLRHFTPAVRRVFGRSIKNASKINKLAGGLGFEPRLTESESSLSPLESIA
jgi:hypothetical protein